MNQWIQKDWNHFLIEPLQTSTLHLIQIRDSINISQINQMKIH